MATILVVEDEPALLGMLVRVLTHAGLGDVLSAPNGAVALKLTEEHPVHVVVTDLLMPHVTGYDLIDRLREHPARNSRALRGVPIPGV
jgi:CheY-like chemotaxis protein